MNEETMRKIYEPFFTTKDSDRGTGLGLSTVYGIVKQNNGNIIVQSEENVGTTFNIYWPIYNNEILKNKELKESEDIVREGNEKILFAEDDDNIRTVTAEFLKNYGYTVAEVSNGFEALDLINNPDNIFDLLIVDLIMPKMNAKELSDKIKEKYPESRVIYCSGYIDNDVIGNDWMQKGINFIQKPYDINKLIRKIREVSKKNDISSALVNNLT